MAYICIEYRCPCGHRHASLETRGEVPDSKPCDVEGCDGVSERTISAPRLSIPIVSVTRTGRSTSERPPGVPDTRMLADGYSYREWRKKHEPRPEKDDDLRRAVSRVRSLRESQL